MKIKNYNKSLLPVNLKITAKLYLLAVSIFFLFRLVLFFTQTEKLIDTSFGNIVHAFLMGLRFDVVISSYLLLLPAVVLTIFTFIGKKFKVMEKIMVAFLTIIFSLTFIVCGADIPYFNQFFNRFNVTAFDWLKGEGELKFMVGMIIEEPRYWLILVPVILLVVGYLCAVRRIFAKTEKWESGHLISKTIFSLLLLIMMIIGIRGRLDHKSPIRVGTAYFCDNAFLNMLGLNPNYTLMRSYLEQKSSKNKEVFFMDDVEAIKKVRSYFCIQDSDYSDSDNSISRDIVSTQPCNNYNVIVILMEGMSADKMTRHGNPDNLTPFLDSLSQEGLYYENCFTTGTHTYCGIFSTICSFPTIYQQHPLKRTPILHYNSIANILKNNNYSTIFFLTHDSQFDNMNGFLIANDYDKIISKSDYPSHEVKTTLGVPDDYMFRYSIPILNEMGKSGRPFFATFMTASDHGPYYIPEYFSPRNEDLKKQIVEYADYSLHQFMQMAKEQEWFDNTIFAFVADHGYSEDALYSVPVSYIHSPLLFYSPALIADSVSDAVASQMDLFPTMMGLLEVSYNNNTLGVDLRRERRKYAISTTDDKYAVLDGEWMLIVNNKDLSPNKLYKYKERDTKDYSSEFPIIVEEMNTFAKSNYQVTEQVMRGGNSD